MIYPLLRPALFLLDAESAHGLSIATLKALPLHGTDRSDGPLATEVAGLHFPNPLGMAAGFDKDAEVPDALLGLGFGFAEVGSITPLPQAGNPRPRLFRLAEDRAVINRMGFNNGGAEQAVERLARRHGRPGIVGPRIAWLGTARQLFAQHMDEEFARFGKEVMRLSVYRHADLHFLGHDVPLTPATMRG